MSIRAKLLIVFLAFGVTPMLALGVLNYTRGVRTVENLLRRDVEESAARVAKSIEDNLARRQTNLEEQANAPLLREHMARRGEAGEAARTDVPRDLRDDLGSFFREYRAYYEAITCVDAAGRPLFRVRQTIDKGVYEETKFDSPAEISTDSLPTEVAAWRAGDAASLRTQRSDARREGYGLAVHYILPIIVSDKVRGALVADLKLDPLFAEAEGAHAASIRSTVAQAASEDAQPKSRVVMIINGDGQVVYHTNRTLQFQAVASAMPYLGEIAERMKRAAREGTGGGAALYKNDAGEEWLAAYRPLPGLHLAVAVAGDYSEAVEGLRSAGRIGVALSLVTALIAAGLLSLLVERVTRRIRLVARAAGAIAAGDLERRIEVESKDETKALAESFNFMSGRLREMIAREAESRQFETFTRLSAMLTHDLKNSIGSLDMLVRNMERQFHRAEFRQDAIVSLRAATDKLRSILSRLSAPRQAEEIDPSEYPPVDIVPIIRRALARATGAPSQTTLEPSGVGANVESESKYSTAKSKGVQLASLYEIETHLPTTPLRARVEPQAIEKVIENLIINAMEAMGLQGGRLTIEAGEDEAAREVFFSVADTGAGMDEEFQRTRLFHPFATTKSSGTGLGLYACREIVAAHAGRIEVESKVGSGTRFRVVLPSAIR